MISVIPIVVYPSLSPMYPKTELSAPPKSDNTFPMNCCSFSLSTVCDDVEADDELICWAYAITAKFISMTHLKRYIRYRTQPMSRERQLS